MQKNKDRNQIYTPTLIENQIFSAVGYNNVNISTEKIANRINGNRKPNLIYYRQLCLGSYITLTDSKLSYQSLLQKLNYQRINEPFEMLVVIFLQATIISQSQ